MTSRYFCTLFDSGYLLKGAAMLKSLDQYCPGTHVYILCMDEKAQSILTQMNLSFVSCISLSEVEDEELLSVKNDRSVAEYCWTLSSSFTWYVLQKYTEIDFITYLDADLLFYSSIDPVFDEIGDSSIAIIEHRFTPRFKELEINGRFCVEWVSFRRDEEGMACLSRWREQCIDWCYYQLEEDRMGDQKYLDEWPERYPSCHIIQHEGAGIAPWNYAQYNFGINTDGKITVEGELLIFYHFHQFQLLDNGGFNRLSAFYTSECPEPSTIYQYYEDSLTRVIQEVRKIEPGFSAGMKSALSVNLRRWVQCFLPGWIKDILRRFTNLH